MHFWCNSLHFWLVVWTSDLSKICCSFPKRRRPDANLSGEDFDGGEWICSLAISCRLTAINVDQDIENSQFHSSWAKTPILNANLIDEKRRSPADWFHWKILKAFMSNVSCYTNLSQQICEKDFSPIRHTTCVRKIHRLNGGTLGMHPKGPLIINHNQPHRHLIYW